MSAKGEDLKRDRVGELLNLAPACRFIRFKGAAMMSGTGTHGFKNLTATDFAPIAYDKFGLGISNASIKDMQHAIESVAPDWSDKDRFIAFHDRVWDMKKLDWAPNQLDYVYSSDIIINDSAEWIAKVQDYLLALADGDEELAHDYIQLAAPLFMYLKPMGIIWLLGVGANGKSAYLDAWYMILAKHFAEQSIDMIEDGRAAPALRGILGNIVREASEKRIEDDKHYKNMGAHETFPIRMLGTHDVLTVDANFHTIMNANNAPVFEDKSNGARRRTLLVPFPATFPDDPAFKENTFMPEFLGALVYLTLMETKKIAANGYQWSPRTAALQEQYNKDANTAEAYANFLLDQNVVGFKNYTILRIHYENWSSDMSSTPLGRKQIARAFENVMKVTLRAYKQEGVTVKRYIKDGVNHEDVVWLESGLCVLKEKDKQAQLTLGPEGGQERVW